MWRGGSGFLLLVSRQVLLLQLRGQSCCSSVDIASTPTPQGRRDPSAASCPGVPPSPDNAPLLGEGTEAPRLI